jgi:hypothetical protein
MGEKELTSDDRLRILLRWLSNYEIDSMTFRGNEIIVRGRTRDIYE